MEFKNINPDKIKVGTLARFTFFKSTYKVVDITYRGLDKDNIPFVCGHLENKNGLNMSFSYRESYSYLTFFNPSVKTVKVEGVGNIPENTMYAIMRD